MRSPIGLLGLSDRSLSLMQEVDKSFLQHSRFKAMEKSLRNECIHHQILTTSLRVLLVKYEIIFQDVVYFPDEVVSGSYFYMHDFHVYLWLKVDGSMSMFLF
jgi:hypothetical protein